MNLLALQSVIQLSIWGIGLIQLILALYVLVLNSRHSANRHTSALFLLLAINSFALGLLLAAKNAAEAWLPVAALAPTSMMMGTALLLTAIILIKPEWMSGRWRWAWRILYILLALPIALTIFSLVPDSKFWFTSLPGTYSGGYLTLAEYTAPELSGLRFFLLMGMPLFTLLPLTYWSFLDKTLNQQKRNLARLLLAAQIGVTFLQVGLRPFLLDLIPIIVSNTLFFAVYAYAGFSQAISERRLQRGRIQIRLTALVLVISIPLLIFTSAYLFAQTSTQIRQNSVDRLAQASQAIATNTETWLELNIKALASMNAQPGIASMDADLQKPILQAVAQAYPHMSLVSTANLRGFNVARSDENALEDYSDQTWFVQSSQVKEVAFQTLVESTTGEPSLIVAKPIYSASGATLGVSMFASELNALSAEVATLRFGETGQLFIVDPSNRVVAHTVPEYANQLVNLSQHPAVARMRNQDNLDQGGIRYIDQDGTIWVSYYSEIEHGWGVVAEQTESELLAPLHSLQISTWAVIIFGTFLLGILSALTIRQAMQPINSLTETATAIAAGDLSRLAPVESVDEFGVLAQTFNRMTEQLLELISNLEERVAERTKALENRSKQLEAAADVGRSASSILEANELMRNTVDLIRERFDLYYVGLFLVDENREYAVLHAGTGKAGETMLSRRHMIRIGEGMIGWTVANSLPRVAKDVGEDALRKATTELPLTRSEATLPLRSRGLVIGAITVQSVRPNEFDESTIAVLQTMADLISVAIDNARLYTETEYALQSTRRAFSELSHDDWIKLLQTRSELSFRSDRSGTTKVSNFWSRDMERAWIKNSTVVNDDRQSSADAHKIAIPIRVRGNVIGVLQTQKPVDSGNWTAEERLILETILEQLGVALDSARLFEETQIQANNERLIGEISAHMRQTLNIESVLQTAARELRSVLDLAEVEIRMGNHPDDKRQT